MYLIFSEAMNVYIVLNYVYSLLRTHVDNFQRCLNLLSSVAVLWHQSADPLGTIKYKIGFSLLDEQALAN